MATQLFKFEWRVPTQGFRWTKVPLTGVERAVHKKGAGWVLQENPRPAWGADAPRWTTCTPLQEATGLYREFAETPPTKDGVMAFATKYGLLGAFEYLDPPTEQDPSEIRGERLADWIKHIQAMKQAVDVWDRLQQKDRDGLVELQTSRRLFTDRRKIPAERFTRPSASDEQPPDDRSWDSFYHESPYLIANDQLPEVALSFLQITMNQHLSGFGVSTQVRRDQQRTGGLAYYVVPESLLGAMWLQLAEAISENKHYNRCRQCDQPFEVSTSPTGARISRRYCSVACKNQYHYQQRTETKRLRSQGLSEGRIAERLDVPLKSVKGWLKSEPSSRSRSSR